MYTNLNDCISLGIVLEYRCTKFIWSCISTQSIFATLLKRMYFLLSSVMVMHLEIIMDISVTIGSHV